MHRSPTDYLRSCNKTKVVMRDINPKSITTQEFYGYVNMSTREWKDGMMSYYMCVSSPPSKMKIRSG